MDGTKLWLEEMKASEVERNVEVIAPSTTAVCEVVMDRCPEMFETRSQMLCRPFKPLKMVWDSWVRLDDGLVFEGVEVSEVDKMVMVGEPSDTIVTEVPKVTGGLARLIRPVPGTAANMPEVAGKFAEVSEDSSQEGMVVEVAVVTEMEKVFMVVEPCDNRGMEVEAVAGGLAR